MLITRFVSVGKKDSLDEALQTKSDSILKFKVKDGVMETSVSYIGGNRIVGVQNGKVISGYNFQNKIYKNKEELKKVIKKKMIFFGFKDIEDKVNSFDPSKNSIDFDIKEKTTRKVKVGDKVFYNGEEGKIIEELPDYENPHTEKKGIGITIKMEDGEVYDDFIKTVRKRSK